MSETNRIEYKQELNNDVDIEKEVIAFLNYHEGGIIYIGIDKQGNTVGVADVDGDMLKIKDRIKNNISPSAMGLFDVVAETKDGKNLIKIIVAGGSEKPYFKKKYGMTEKGCFIRIGTASEPMPQAMTESVKDEITVRIVYEGRAAKVALNNTELEKIEKYYEEAAEAGANEYQIEQSKEESAKMNAILGDPKRLLTLAEDFVKHYENRISEGATVKGKAMFVCSTREIAWEFYKNVIALKPEWNEVRIAEEGAVLSDKDKREIKPMGAIIARQNPLLFKRR